MRPSTSTLVPLLILFLGVLAAAAGLSLSDRSPAFALAPALIALLLIGGYAAISVTEGQRWPLVLIFLLCVVLFTVSFRPPDREVVAAATKQRDLQSYAKFAFLLLVFAVGVVSFNRITEILLTTTGKLLALYASFAALSFLYSITPTTTLGASFGIVAWMLFAAVLTQRFEEDEILNLILTSLAMVILASWVIYLAFPELGRFKMTLGNSIRFTGVTDRPNNAGGIAATYIAVFAYHRFMRPRTGMERDKVLQLLQLTVLPLAIGMLLLSGSRGALLSLCGALFTLVLARHRSFPIVATIAVSMTLLYLYVPNPLALAESLLVSASRSGQLSEIMTLTGRTAIWDFVWSRISEAPWIGYGYRAGGEVIAQGFYDQWGNNWASGAHNMWLQSLLDIGFLGTSILAAIFVYSGYLYFQRPYPIRDIFFAITILKGLLEGSITNSISFSFFLWVLSLFMGEVAVERHRSAPRLDPGTTPVSRP